MSFYVGRVFVAVIAIALAADLLQHHGVLPTIHMAETLATPAQDAVAVNHRHIDYCNCPQGDVDANSALVLAVVNRIVRSPYFRYFKVNTHKECPYWAVQLLCTSADNPCALCTCNEEDVPMDVRNEPGDMSDVTTVGGATDDDVTKGVTPASIESWGFSMGGAGAAGPGQNSDLKAHQATGSESSADDAVYVDLVLNPEGNTGYTGPMANKVWEAIYLENCLKDVSERMQVPADEAAQCSEFQVFYRLMSGFHSSIGINVATNFHRAGFEQLPPPQVEKTSDDVGEAAEPPDHHHQRVPLYTPNCDMLRRLRSFQERRDNLNLLYQFTLRAVAKAAPLFLHDAASMYQSGNPMEDAALVRDLEALFASPLLCSATFDDVAFLESPYAQRLVPQMTRMMKNISTLMDCVACEKCRLWGKLETQGIAAAIKIVMATASGGAAGGPKHKGGNDDGQQPLVEDCRLNERDIAHDDVQDVREDIKGASKSHPSFSSSAPLSQATAKVLLKRGEKVALMNLLRQLTVAVWSMNHNCL